MDTRHKQSRTDVVTSVPLLISLVLLVGNDWYLKSAYGNWFTGKLSDFAGIFLLALIAFAALPNRRRMTAVGICVAFALWKSSLVEPLITLIHTWGLIRFGRVVDYTDLMALVMVPMAWAFVVWRAQHPRANHALRRTVALPMLGICAMSMVATSWATTVERKFDIKTNHTAQEFDAYAVTSAIRDVANDFGLECYPDKEPMISGICTGDGMFINYVLDQSGTLNIRVSATEGGSGFRFRPKADIKKKIRRFKKSLRSAVRQAVEISEGEKALSVEEKTDGGALAE